MEKWDLFLFPIVWLLQFLATSFFIFLLNFFFYCQFSSLGNFSSHTGSLHLLHLNTPKTEIFSLSLSIFFQIWENMHTKKGKESEEKSKENGDKTGLSTFPDEVLERVLGFVKSHKDRSSVSLVCKEWYDAERWSRTHVFIGNCYSVSPEILIRRFPNIRSVTMKGKPRFSDFNLVPPNWGANIRYWLDPFSSAYPFLEELRLKRMTVTDESLDFLARSFPNFRALSLVTCDGFSTDGLASVAAHCRWDPLLSFNPFQFSAVFFVPWSSNFDVLLRFRAFISVLLWYLRGFFFFFSVLGDGFFVSFNWSDLVSGEVTACWNRFLRD